MGCMCCCAAAAAAADALGFFAAFLLGGGGAGGGTGTAGWQTGCKAGALASGGLSRDPPLKVLAR